MIAVLVPWLFGVVAGLFSPDADPIARDKDRIRSRAERNAQYIAEQRTLKGAEADSWFIVVRHESVNDLRYLSVAPLSDEIRIYEETTDGLQLVFRFRPQAEKHPPIPFTPPTKKKARPYTFQVRATPDLDGDGNQEVVGAFSYVIVDSVLPLPVVVSRPTDFQPFQVQPARAFWLGRPPSSRGGLWADFRQPWYRWLSNLRDDRTRTSIQVQPVEEYAFVPKDAVLIAIYVVKSKCHFCATVLSMRAERISISQGGRVETIPCIFREGRYVQAPHSRVETFSKFATELWRDENGSREISDVCPVRSSYFKGY